MVSHKGDDHGAVLGGTQGRECISRCHSVLGESLVSLVSMDQLFRQGVGGGAPPLRDGKTGNYSNRRLLSNSQEESSVIGTKRVRLVLVAVLLCRERGVSC